MKNLFLKGRMIYRKIPTCFRWVFLPVKLIVRLIRITLKPIGILRLGLWIITGEEITSKQEFAIIYFGIEEKKNYFVKLAYDNNYREKYLGKTWMWEFFKKAKRKDHGCSLMVAEVPKVFRILFGKNEYFHIPSSVDGEIDISAGISSFIKNDSVKTDLRKIRKNELSFEVTNEISQLHNFYYNMYLPYMIKAHGNRAFFASYDYFKGEFSKCDLLLIKKKTEYIAGNLILYQKDSARVWVLGLKDGNMDYMKQGAVAAQYYFSVHYLKEKGLKKVSYGLSRAFLKDGVLQFKKKRGLQICDTPRGDFLIKPLSKTPGVKAFFLNNPFIYMDKGRFNAAIFIEADLPLSEKDFEKIYKDYYLSGMSKLVIYRFGESGNRIQEIVPTEFRDRITMRSAGSLFNR